MPGPNSVPLRDREFYLELQCKICDKHKECWEDSPNSNFKDYTHSFVTKREYLLKRNKLQTGKTRRS